MSRSKKEDPAARANAVACDFCGGSRPREKRTRRRRHQGRLKSEVVLRAVLTVRSCVTAAEGLLLRHGPTFDKSRCPAVGATGRPLQTSGLGPGRPFGMSRRWCTGFNVDGDDIGGGERTGSRGAAGAVHTLLIDNYDSYTYNLFQLLAVVNGQAPFVVFNDDDGGDLWRAIERMGRAPDNIVISPGPGRPDVPEDFGMCAQALSEATDIPILGVCLGHEGLGIAHGARVVRAAEPMHGRLSPIYHDGEDALFRDVPQGSRVVRYHSLVVDRETLPAGAGAGAGASGVGGGGAGLRATAWTGDGVLMAMKHEERPHWGVQFHPESVGTRHGSDIVRNFRDLTVAWRGAAAAGAAAGGRAGAAAARETIGGRGGGGHGDALSKQGLGAPRKGAPGGILRNGLGRPRTRSGAAAAVALEGGQDLPSSEFSSYNAERTAETADGVVYQALDEQATAGAAAAAAAAAAKAAAPERSRLDGSGGRSAARQRRSFVLRVEEVDMGGRRLDADGDGHGTNNGRRPAGSAMPDTEHAFRALYGDDPTAWWLDSSSQRPGLAVDGQAKARFTFMGGADGPLSQTIECYGEGRLVVQQGAGGAGGRRRREVRANIMDYLKAEMAKMGHADNGGVALNGHNTTTNTTNTNTNTCHGLEIRMVGGREEGAGGGDDTARAEDNGHRVASLPFDFVGGFVGFLGYELRHEANDVLVRSAGGTEWDWQPPGGGRWEDVAFESEETVQGAAPGGLAERAASEVVAGGGRGHGAGGGFAGDAASRGRDGSGGGGGAGVGVGDGDVPLGFLVFVDRFVAFDHQDGKAYVLAMSRTGAPSDTGGGGVGDTDAAVAADGTHPVWTTTAAAATPTEEDGDASLDWIHRTAESLRALSFLSPPVDGGVSEKEEDVTAAAAAAAAAAASRSGDVVTATTTCSMDVPRSRYEQNLEEIMRLVEEGETYEVCLTNQIVCERPKGGDGGTAGAKERRKTRPLDLYSCLRRSNPAPYAAYIVHDPHRRLSSAPTAGGDDGVGGVQEAEGGGDVGGGGSGPAFAVCCSSPEKFLKVDGHGWVESKPIKGTVKRGKTPAEDLILAAELAKGEKNMAENLMIVDLVRNDLGRVCQTGSVSVPKLMHVESYATVHQLVSTIRGRLRPNCGALDAIAAAFPGGSMTGAPKQRTMAIIDRLERGRSRGVYSGSIGFLGVDGAADFNIVIRTAVVTPQNVTVGAGGAVIALSEVDDEYEEMLLKATSVLGALGHENRAGTGGPAGSEPTRPTPLPPAPSSRPEEAPVVSRGDKEKKEGVL
eukprot:g9106.t1